MTEEHRYNCTTEEWEDAAWPEPRGWVDNWPRAIPAIIVGAAILGGALLAWSASAQDGAPCAPRDRIVSQLESKYGETRRGAGLQSRGSVTEVFASAETGTWTILVTRPDGTSCAVAAGEAWIDDVAKMGPPT